MNKGDQKAFACDHNYSETLTKREYFAAMAMQGLLASWGEHDVTDFAEIASDSVKAADSLLAALDSSNK